MSDGTAVQYSTEDELAGWLEKATSKLQIVLDSGFIPRHEVSQRLWSAILSHDLLILPTVKRELEQYSPSGNAPIHDAIGQAEQNANSNLEHVSRLGIESDLGRGVRYYVRLLALRKQAVTFAEKRFRNREGREPSDIELSNEVSQLVGRGTTLAKKGVLDQDKPNWCFDEILVVRAVTIGLERGRETVILTRDNDLLEQFYNFVYLLDTHYRASIIAEHYKAQPLNFIESIPTIKGTFLEECVEPENALFLKLPVDASRRLLPEIYHPVPVHVLCLAGREPPQFKFTGLVFCFETAMIEVIRNKGREGSRNASWDDPRDVHICLHPRFQDELGGYALLGRNRVAVIDGVEICPIDVNMTMQSAERVGRVEYILDSASTDNDQASGESLGSYANPARLGVAKSSAWHDLGCAGLATSIVHTVPWTSFVLDPSFLRLPVSDLFVEAMARRRRVVTLANSWKRASSDPLPNSLGARFGVRAPRWLTLLPPIHTDGPLRWCFDYFLALIKHKRLLGRITETQLAALLGRPPTDEEFRTAILEYREGPRKLLRATRGRYCNQVDDDADALMVCSIIDAIVDGCDSVVLSADRAATEQFITLAGLTSSDYRAWWFGRESKFDFTRDVPAEHDDFSKMGFALPPVMVELEFENAIRNLPPDTFPTQLACWLIETNDQGKSHKVLPTWFSAERSMASMLAFKQEINGQSASLSKNADVHWKQVQGTSGPQVMLFIGPNNRTRIGSSDFLIDGETGLILDSVPTFSLLRAQNFCDPISLPWHSDFPSDEFLWDPSTSNR